MLAGTSEMMGAKKVGKHPDRLSGLETSKVSTSMSGRIPDRPGNVDTSTPDRKASNGMGDRVSSRTPGAVSDGVDERGPNRTGGPAPDRISGRVSYNLATTLVPADRVSDKLRGRLPDRAGSGGGHGRVNERVAKRSRTDALESKALGRL